MVDVASQPTNSVLSSNEVVSEWHIHSPRISSSLVHRYPCSLTVVASEIPSQIQILRGANVLVHSTELFPLSDRTVRPRNTNFQ